ncbi:MAG: TonB family protein, partial [Bacteroidota bacterium]
MNRYLQLITLLFLPLFSFAQNDTIYFDRNWKKCSQSTAVYYRLVQPVSQTKFKVIDYFVSNNKIAMTGYSAWPDTLVKNGYFVFYNQNGIIDREGNFIVDHGQGLWKYYYPDTAIVWFTQNYNVGILHGEFSSYYRNGKVKRTAMYNKGELLNGNCFNESGDTMPYTPFIILPEFNGDRMEFLSKNIKYPNYARENKISGKVVAKFVVTKTGEIDDISIVKSVDKSLDEETVR